MDARAFLDGCRSGGIEPSAGRDRKLSRLSVLLRSGCRDPEGFQRHPNQSIPIRAIPISQRGEQMRAYLLQEATSFPGRLGRGQLDRAALLIVLALAWSTTVLSQVNVTERGYDHFRTGANTTETVLTPANVNSGANKFHKQFVMRVDGKIEGSPLYASGVSIAGGTHNVIYVGTMHNTVFAFDADTGAQLSARWLGNPVTGFDLHTLKPATIHTEWGILSTPVIDLTTGTFYVVRWGYENGTSGPTYRLFGLDMTN